MELHGIALSEYAADLLKRDAEFHVLAVFDHVLNLANGKEILSLQDPSIPRTPLSFILPEAEFLCLRNSTDTGHIFRTDDGMLRHNEHIILSRSAERFSCQMTAANLAEGANWYVRLKRMAVLLAKPGSFTFIASPELQAWAGEELTAVQQRARDCLSQETPQELVGLGGGLTPAGDDFLVGVLAALRWMGKSEDCARLAGQLVPRLGRTPEISRAFLARALVWEFSQPVLNLFTSMEKGCGLAEAISELCAIGHSSGSDLLGGVLWTLKHEHKEEIT